MAGLGTVAVIGLGRLGTSIAIGLTRRGTQVLAVDIREHVVQRLADELPQIVCADGTDVVALQQAGVSAATQTVVAIASRPQASMLCTLALSELGIPAVWAAASDARHARILQSLGAHRVLLPAHEAAHQTAERLTRHHRWRIRYSSNDFAIATIAASPAVAARLAGVGPDAGVVAAVKAGDQTRVFRPGDALAPDDTIVIAGPSNLVQHILQGGE